MSSWKLAFLAQLLLLIMPITQFKIIGNVFDNWIFVLIAITHLWTRAISRQWFSNLSSRSNSRTTSTSSPSSTISQRSQSICPRPTLSNTLRFTSSNSSTSTCQLLTSHNNNNSSSSSSSSKSRAMSLILTSISSKCSIAKCSRVIKRSRTSCTNNSSSTFSRQATAPLWTTR